MAADVDQSGTTAAIRGLFTVRVNQGSSVKLCCHCALVRVLIVITEATAWRQLPKPQTATQLLTLPIAAENAVPKAFYVASNKQF